MRKWMLGILAVLVLSLVLMCGFAATFVGEQTTMRRVMTSFLWARGYTVYVGANKVIIRGRTNYQTGCQFQANITLSPDFYVRNNCWDRSG